MSPPEVLLRVVYVVAGLLVALAIGWLGRVFARRLRQPAVIGEIVAGVVAGPVAAAFLGVGTVAVLLPAGMVDSLQLLAEVGLILFLVGVGSEIRFGGRWATATGWVVLGGLLPALLSGTAFAGWVLFAEDVDVRGTAPLPAFVTMCAVALSLTAVPVLARILADRGMTHTTEAQLALAAAVVIDTIGWSLLSVAVGLTAGRVDGFLRAMAVLGGGLVLALVVRRALHSRFAGTLCRRRPVVAATLVAVIALAGALTAERLGLTAIFGAVMVGLALPLGGAWTAVVASVTRVGRALIPVFFVVTGLTVFATGLGLMPWTLVIVAVVLAILGKGGGSYVGARMAGETHGTAAKVGVLMNTRGLTELVVLEVGYSAGLLTAPIVAALVVMTVVTTVMTGPLMLVLDRRTVRPGPGSTG